MAPYCFHFTVTKLVLLFCLKFVVFVTDSNIVQLGRVYGECVENKRTEQNNQTIKHTHLTSHNCAQRTRFNVYDKKSCRFHNSSDSNSSTSVRSMCIFVFVIKCVYFVGGKNV